MKLAAGLKKILGIGENSHKHAGQVLVLDGADVVGHRVVERLIDAEYPHVRVGMRKLHDKQETRGFELVPFVWENEDTYTNALKDVKTVFVTTPIKPSDWDTHFPKFLKACSANKVKRIVKLSFYHSIRSKTEHLSKHFGDPNKAIATHGDRFYDVPFVHKHALCDGDLIVRKELSVTLLFASHLMSNVFRYGAEKKALKESHEFYGASDGKGVNYVSPNDVADVAVKAIFDKIHKRQGYTLTGPVAITDGDVAKLLSEQLGTKITYAEKPLDFFDEDTAALEKMKATGAEVEFSKGDTKKVLGRDPETFEDYLRATNRMSPVEQEVMSLAARAPAKEADDVVMTAEKEGEKKEESEPAEQTEAATEKEEETKEEEEAAPTATEGAIEPTATEDTIEPTETEVEVVEKDYMNTTPEQAQPGVEAQ